MKRAWHPTQGHLCALAGAALLSACAAWAPPAAEPASTVTEVSTPSAAAETPVQLSGRLSLRIKRLDDGSTDGGSMLFDFEGQTTRGSLDLSTPVGTSLARIQWNADGAEVKTPQGSRRGATLDELGSALLGEWLPLAALLHWIRAEPWPLAPHSTQAEGFEQLGWSISLVAWHENVVTAHRGAATSGAAPTDITVRVRLDQKPGGPKNRGGGDGGE